MILKKIFSISLFFSFNFIFSDPLLDCYRENCSNDLENKAEQLLQSKKYWRDRLAQYDTDFGYYENLRYLLVVDKDQPWLDLYEIKSGHSVEIIKTIDVIVGKNSGQKLYKGDLKTPTGVYKLTERLNNLDQFYGPTAIVIAYPNALDKVLKRTGSGIWIHGFPLREDRNLITENTKGCVAMENDRVLDLANILSNLNQTLIILTDGRLTRVNKDDLAGILSGLYSWLASWRESEYKKNISFYSRKFKTIEGNDISWLRDLKQRIFKESKELKLYFNKINIAPYPNSENRKLFYISGLLQYSDGKKSFKGYKELYVELNNGLFEILIEK
jgi:murein L,D-transpeptidase YafK